MNIEHRTLNVQHRIMYSACREPLCRTVNLKKKTEQSEATLRNPTRLPSTSSGPEHIEGSHSTLSSRPKGSSQAAVFRSHLQRDSLVLKSIKRSVINIGRSMLDVRPARNALKPVRGKSNNLIHNSMIMLTQRTMRGRRVFDVQSVHCSGQAEFHMRCQVLGLKGAKS